MKGLLKMTNEFITALFNDNIFQWGLVFGGLYVLHFVSSVFLFSCAVIKLIKIIKISKQKEEKDK